MWHYHIGKHIQVIFRVNSFTIAHDKSIFAELYSKWAILLSQYEIQFMPQKVIKGQAVSDFLVNHPVLGTSKLYDDLPDKVAEVNIINASSEEQVW